MKELFDGFTSKEVAVMVVEAVIGLAGIWLLLVGLLAVWG